MTIRLDMCRSVSRAGDALGDSLDVVRGFFRRQLAPDGGFQGRDGRSDLYYTAFGLEASLVLGVDLPHEQVNTYLASFAAGEALDLVHLASLIRCQANLAEACSPAAPGWEKTTPEGGSGSQTRPFRVWGPGATREGMARRLLEHRSRDGGFHTVAGAPRGNAYGSFLALGACQDLGLDLAGLEAMAESVRSLQRPDGGYSNEAAMAVSATPATAAAISVLHYLREPVPEAAVRWLLDRRHPLGGFVAVPMGKDGGSVPGGSVKPEDLGGRPIDDSGHPQAALEAATRQFEDHTLTYGVPDLLSTATALHALSLVGALAEDGREKHLDYLDTLWSTQGGFRGHWGDETVDCEYTYYGLLSLGCLVG